MNDAVSTRELRKEVGARQFFSLAFGCIIGVAWVVVLGEWLGLAGPLGAMIGFFVGGLAMMVIGICYAELVTALPAAGGEVVYAYEVFGTKTSFLVGWFLVLVYVAAAAFEAISFAWVLDVLVPGWQGSTLYTALGFPVKTGSIVLGVGGTVGLTWLNYRGVKPATRLQDMLTFGLIALAVVFFAAGIGWGKLGNLEPLFPVNPAAPVWRGVLWVLVTSPFWFSGFQVVPQVVEERTAGTSLQIVGRIIVWAIAFALLFYCLLILSSSMAAPWTWLVHHELPAAAALQAAFGSSFFSRLVLIAAVLGILTTWNAVFVVGTRLLFALGRARMISPGVGVVHPRYGSPAWAVLLVGSLGSLGVFLGRNAIVPLANLGATCFTMAFIVSCWAVVKLRKQRPEMRRPYRVPGGKATALAATIVSVLLFLFSFYEQYQRSKGPVPLEWALFFGWGAIGASFWLLARPVRSSVTEAERRRLVLGTLESRSEPNVRKDGFRGEYEL
jgi:APA family basic amino acid/polyamine antiporter